VLGFCWYGFVVSFCFAFGLEISLKRSEERFRLMLWLGCAYKVP
jgi:hypothetical protein